MTPSSAITALDRQLRKHGHDALLRRQAWAGTVRTSADLPVRVCLRGYRPDELTGGIVQGDSEIVISPTELGASAWPDGAGELPRQGDVIISGSRSLAVIAVDPRYIGGDLVRINLQVRG
ncbi:hypothetical protein NVS89_22505 [Ancylobacter sp. MQZ15Z-1]|uniref:Uncharacterized protein n=1 Tax=Ancylobacter mangrovi TaxID=2972472 RepID=A0A9X2PIT4_9HYPH|nr:hypothetical protein [Ancylobacter mangrovi]MCS0497866.1 hypothetical protein [Ancylobacter mangrovi]